jgi:quercetin dioxygenase-like cupin family protein
MENVSLTALASEQLDAARQTSSGRASRTVYGGQEHSLRQTLIALLAGRELSEHESPGEATVQVLQGRVHLSGGGEAGSGSTGDLLVVPDTRHALHADEDSVVILTVAMRVPESTGP